MNGETNKNVKCILSRESKSYSPAIRGCGTSRILAQTRRICDMQMADLVLSAGQSYTQIISRFQFALCHEPRKGRSIALFHGFLPRYSFIQCTVVPSMVLTGEDAIK
jgi:hypothetical protein